MTSLYFTYFILRFLYSVPSSSIFHFVDKQVVTVYEQSAYWALAGRRAPNRQLAGQHWTKDFHVHAQGWLEKKKELAENMKELANLGQRVFTCMPASGLGSIMIIIVIDCN